MYIILVYDIAIEDGGPRVLRNVFKIASKYLMRIQNSVFEGEISEVSFLKLKNEICDHIRDKKDSLVIFKLNNKNWLEKEILGKGEELTSNFF